MRVRLRAGKGSRRGHDQTRVRGLLIVVAAAAGLTGAVASGGGTRSSAAVRPEQPPRAELVRGCRSPIILVRPTFRACTHPIGAYEGAVAAFRPVEGRYVRRYTSGRHGPGYARLRVGGFLRPGRRLPAVRLLEWSGRLRCPGRRAQSVDDPLTAARDGRTFSGFQLFPGGRTSFTGRFTARNALEATVRVTRGTGAARCDTGAIRIVARAVTR